MPDIDLGYTADAWAEPVQQENFESMTPCPNPPTLPEKRVISSWEQTQQSQLLMGKKQNSAPICMF